MSPAEKHYGVVPIGALKDMSGLEMLRAIRDGRHPHPPMSRALDFHLVEVEAGRALFRGRPSAQFNNPLGAVHGGWAATLLDSCMTCAVQSTLPKGSGCTTLEFKVSLLRAITADSGPVEAEGRAVQSGRRVGAAEGRLTDSQGKLLATGSTTCLVTALDGAYTKGR